MLRSLASAARASTRASARRAALCLVPHGAAAAAAYSKPLAGSWPAARPFSGASMAGLASTTPASLRSSLAVAASYSNVDVQGASELLQGGVPYVDVRTPEEYAAGHAPSATCVSVMLKGPAGMSPNPDFVKQFEAAFPDKSAEVCVGCQSGKRSVAAAQLLAAAGYTGVKNVEGGFMAWAGAKLPVEA